jgi:hypothetical protein
MGGAASVLAATRGLEVERLALIAPPASPTRFAEQFASTLRLDADVVVALRERVESRLNMPFSDLEVAGLARALKQDLLVIHDEGDRDVSIDDGRAIFANARRAKLITTTGLGHRKILRDPSVLQHVVSFIRKESRAPRRPSTASIAPASPFDNTPALLDSLL